tara:strand:- start:3976 stop:4587 length:612 start_codon:yes stop_codon:yes gene_type:complete
MLRIGSLAGIASPIIGILMVLLSIYFSPWFSWQENALSDLGVEQSGGTQIAIYLFNIGMIIAGSLIALFVVLTRSILASNRRNKIAYAILFIGGINLALVGIFTENFPMVHRTVALMYFVTTPISLMIIGSGKIASDRTFGLFSIGAGAVALVVILGLVFSTLGISTGEIYPEGAAIPEFIEAVILGMWIGIAGIRIFKTGKI